MSIISNYQINLNSLNRFNYLGTNSNNCRFKIQDVITFQNKKKIYLTLPRMTLPPTIYNISSLSGNNTLTFTEDTNPASSPLTMSVSIPSGNYDVSSFITALASAMSTASASSGYAQTYAGSYNAVTGQITMYMVGSPSGYMIKAYTFLGQDRDLKQFLGFNGQYNDITTLNPSPGFSFTDRQG